MDGTTDTQTPNSEAVALHPSCSLNGKRRIGPATPHVKKRVGWALWLENGVYFEAPEVDSAVFGEHVYMDKGKWNGRHKCACGCEMWSSEAFGPVSPFGACPSNPRLSSENVTD